MPPFTFTSLEIYLLSGLFISSLNARLLFKPLSITGNISIELKNKPCIIEKYNINEQNLKEIYIVWNNYEEDYPYIIKCPIKSVSQRSYIISIKDRSRYNIYENYNELKILKKILMRIGDIRLHQVMN